MATKYYYTTRELSNHAVELFALKALGNGALRHMPCGAIGAVTWLSLLMLLSTSLTRGVPVQSCCRATRGCPRSPGTRTTGTRTAAPPTCTSTSSRTTSPAGSRRSRTASGTRPSATTRRGAACSITTWRARGGRRSRCAQWRVPCPRGRRIRAMRLRMRGCRAPTSTASTMTAYPSRGRRSCACGASWMRPPRGSRQCWTCTPGPTHRPPRAPTPEYTP